MNKLQKNLQKGSFFYIKDKVKSKSLFFLRKLGKKRIHYYIFGFANWLNHSVFTYRSFLLIYLHIYVPCPPFSNILDISQTIKPSTCINHTNYIYSRKGSKHLLCTLTCLAISVISVCWRCVR